MKPEKNEMKIERRFIPLAASELRAEGTEKKTITGYAAKFNTEGVDEFWGFREMIMPGAFAATIKADDIRGLFNHDPNHVLGRNTNETLRLFENMVGLRMEDDINEDDPDAMSVYAKIKRGDVTGQSFAFMVDGKDGAEWDESEMKDGKMPLRKLHRLKLFDVGPVTYPFYEETDVAVALRSLEHYRGTIITPPVRDDGNGAPQKRGNILGMRLREKELTIRTRSTR